MRAIFNRQYGILNAPGNADFRIVPYDTALVFREIKIIAFVEKFRRFRQNQVAVSKSGGDVYLPHVFSRQQNAYALPELRRAASNVHNHVQDFALNDAAEL